MTQCVSLINNIITIDKNAIPDFQTAPLIKETANGTQKIDMPTDIANLDTASSHILLLPTHKCVTDTPHKKLSVKFANGTHAESIGSGTIAHGPVTIPVSIMRKNDLVTQLLGIAPFTQAGCEAHLTKDGAVDGRPQTASAPRIRQPSDTHAVNTRKSQLFSMPPR